MHAFFFFFCFWCCFVFGSRVCEREREGERQYLCPFEVDFLDLYIYICVYRARGLFVEWGRGFDTFFVLLDFFFYFFFKN